MFNCATFYVRKKYSTKPNGKKPLNLLLTYCLKSMPSQIDNVVAAYLSTAYLTWHRLRTAG